jgi:hypothetical protein
MADAAQLGGHKTGLFGTRRTDLWWVEPLWTAAGFLGFVAYSTWVMFQDTYFFAEPYLSPFYSPMLFTDPTRPGAAPVGEAWIGEWPSTWPDFLPHSPAFFILIFPLLFRLTCYYYRKFYYRSFFATPPGCAVGPLPQGNYKGERGLLLLQNLHRYAMYVAVLFVLLFAYESVLAFFKHGELGIGVGSVVLTLNFLFLGAYTFGCHSFRHLVGGGKDCFSCGLSGRVAHGAWKKVSWLNSRHMLWAWVSMIWIGLTDVYIRLVSMGVIQDLNTWD